MSPIPPPQRYASEDLVVAQVLSAISDTLAASGRVDIEETIASIPERLWPRVIPDLLAMELSIGPWSVAQVQAYLVRHETLLRFSGSTATVLRACYSNRSTVAQRMYWSDFLPFKIPPDELRLSLENEPNYLGQVVLGRYHVLSRLGSGGISVVFEAEDQRNGARVALKTALDQQFAWTGALLQREFDTLRDLDHPGIPKAIAFETSTEGQPYLVIQYVDGHPLESSLSFGAIEPIEAVRMTLALLEPLAHAHARRITHRDLTPENVLVARDGRVFLTDFNVALHDRDRTSSDGDVVGKYPYSSPEALLGFTAEFDGRVDLWSVGAILYRMLTGEFATSAKSREEALVASMLFDTRPPLFQKHVSQALRTICMRCLDRDLARRFGTVSELAEALKAVLEDREVADPMRNRRLLAWQAGWLLGVARYNHEQCVNLLERYMHNAKTGHAEPDEDTMMRRAALPMADTGVVYEIGSRDKLAELERLLASQGLVCPKIPFHSGLSTLIYKRTASEIASLTPIFETLGQVTNAFDEARVVLAKEFSADDGAKPLFELGHACPLIPLAKKDTVFGMLMDRTNLPDPIRSAFHNWLGKASTETEHRTYVKELNKNVERFLQGVYGIE